MRYYWDFHIYKDVIDENIWPRKQKIWKKRTKVIIINIFPDQLLRHSLSAHAKLMEIIVTAWVRMLLNYSHVKTLVARCKTLYQLLYFSFQKVYLYRRKKKTWILKWVLKWVKKCKFYVLKM